MTHMKVSGPLFDGRYSRYVEGFLKDAKWEVGAQGSANVHQNADGSFKDPTPYYETQITVERRDPDVVVHDRDIVYGPWLERGRSNTRFRGYRIWRRAADKLRREMPGLINPILHRYLRKMREEM